MSVADIRSAMSTALRTVDGWAHVTDYMTDEILPPHLMFDFRVEPHQTFGRISEGGAILRFTIQGYVSRSDDKTGQRLLDEARDPTTSTSVIYVVENNATLAAQCDYAAVRSVGEIQIAVPKGNVEYLMVPFEVEVGV